MEEIQDDVLLDLINSSDENAYMYMIKKYTPQIKIYAKKELEHAKRVGLEFEDLIQEGILGLTKAINTYDKEKDNKFSTYAHIVIKRDIKNYLKKLDNNNNLALNESLSFDDTLKKELEVIDNSYIPGDKITRDELDKEIKKELSVQEIKVYELKKEEKTNKEIASILGKDIKYIENTITRINKKVRKIIRG